MRRSRPRRTWSPVVTRSMSRSSGSTPTIARSAFPSSEPSGALQRKMLPAAMDSATWVATCPSAAAWTTTAPWVRTRSNSDHHRSSSPDHKKDDAHGPAVGVFHLFRVGTAPLCRQGEAHPVASDPKAAINTWRRRTGVQGSRFASGGLRLMRWPRTWVGLLVRSVIVVLGCPGWSGSMAARP